MKFKQAKLKLFILAASLISQGNYADISKSLEGMWNYTKGGAGAVNQNIGGTLGSFAAKFPITKFDIVAFDPPHFNAGCSGIDMYFGSFSMISSDNIKELFRKVVGNAQGYAFQLALKSVCPTCEEIMYKLSEMSASINNMSKNTCEIASMVVDTVANPEKASQEWGDTKKQWDALLGTSKGTFSDIFSAKNNASKGSITPSNAAQSSTLYGNNLINTVFSSKTVDGFKNEIAQNEKELAEILMNLYGFSINVTKEKQIAGSPEANSKPSMWNLKELVNGNGDGQNNLMSYNCVDYNASNMAESCQNVNLSKSTFKGFKYYFIEKLAGKQDIVQGRKYEATKLDKDSIGDKLIYGRELTTEQKAFLSRLPQNVRNALNQVAIQGKSEYLVRLINTLSDLYAEDFAYKYLWQLNDLIKTAYGQNSSNNNKIVANIPLSIRVKVEQFDSIIKEHNDKQLEKINQLSDAIQNSYFIKPQ